MTSAHYNIAVRIDDDAWDVVSDLTALSRKACIAVLRHQNVTPDSEVSIVFTSDTTMQTLNEAHRGQDKPTNVLSFPGTVPLLGDIVLSYETIREEAEEQGKAFDHHVLHLLVHGTLHLLGYDHEKESERESMESLEIQILQTLGIRDPYVI